MNSRSVVASAFPAVALLSFTLSSNVEPSFNLQEIKNLDPCAISQTVSSRQYVPEGSHYYFEMTSPKEEAFMLFGEQQNFTDAEQELFWKVIKAKSIKTGININDLF